MSYFKRLPQWLLVKCSVRSTWTWVIHYLVFFFFCCFSQLWHSHGVKTFWKNGSLDFDRSTILSQGKVAFPTLIRFLHMSHYKISTCNEYSLHMTLCKIFYFNLPIRTLFLCSYQRWLSLRLQIYETVHIRYTARHMSKPVRRVFYVLNIFINRCKGNISLLPPANEVAER